MIHFEVKRAKRGRLKRGQWVAVIKAGNGETLFTSETYNNRQDVLDAVQLVISLVQRGCITEAQED